MKGDSSTEPYKVAHNLLLSHAAAVKTYKEKYQVSNKCTFLLDRVLFNPYEQFIYICVCVCGITLIIENVGISKWEDWDNTQYPLVRTLL